MALPENYAGLNFRRLYITFKYCVNSFSTFRFLICTINLLLSSFLWAESGTEFSYPEPTQRTANIYVIEGTVLVNADQISNTKIVILEKSSKKKKKNISRNKSPKVKERISSVVKKEHIKEEEKPLFVFRPAPSPKEFFLAFMGHVNFGLFQSQQVLKKLKFEDVQVCISNCFLEDVKLESYHEIKYVPITSSDSFTSHFKVRPPPYT